MADKTPVRVVFNSSNVATGMAEFQSGETVPVANGGTGLSSIGSAGQVIKVNAAGNGLEFGAEGDLSITNLVAPTNADLTLRTSGTGGIVLDNITISDNAISTNRSNDDFKINASGSGVINLENLKIGSGATVNTILDEDNFASNDPDALATQQSIKAYVDSAGGISGSSTATFTNKTIDADGSGNNISNIDIGNMTAAVIVTESEGIGSNDNDTTLPTSAAVKDYVDNNSGSPTSITQGNSNVTVADSGTGNVTIEVDAADRITVTAATTTTATGHTITLGATNTTTGGAIKFLEGTDNGTNTVTLVGPASTANVTLSLPSASDTLVGKATTDTFTNKTIDADNNTVSNIEVDNLKSGVLDTDISSVAGTDTTLASAKAIKTYVDAQVTAQDLDFATDDSTALSIDLDSESLQVSGGANITTSGSGNTITIALGTALTGLSSVTSTALVTNSISSSDSTAVRIDDSLNVDGALDVGAGFTISNTTSVTSIVDEDAMGSDSATALATQQSIKAYVDAQDAAIASDTLTLTNKTFDAEGTGNALSNVDVANLKSGVLDTDISSVSGSDDTIASAKAIKTYVDAQIATKDNSDEITEGSTNLYFTNARADARITNALKDEDNFASDSATHVPSQQSVKAYVDAQDANIASDTLTLTNKTFDVEGTGNSISNIDVADLKSGVLDTDISSVAGTDTTLASAKAIKTYADTKAVLSGSTNNQITTVTGAHAIQGESNLTFDGTTFAVTGAVTISGDLTVSGDTATVSSVNTTIADNIIELNTGISQSFNDAGIIIERGTTGNNAFIGWDESADKFTVGTTTATAGDKSGGITVATGTLVANLEGNVTGNVTGNTSGSSGSTTGNAATATALATARAIGGVNFDGTAAINLPGVNTAGNQNTSGTAAIATAVTVADESSDTSCNVVFVTAATGNLPPKTGTNLTFNSSSGVLTATGFAGALTGDVTGNADTATVATTVTITDNESTNENNPIVFVAGGDLDGGNLGLESDGTATYNPSTGKITATGFVGTLTGNVTGDTSGSSGSTTGNAATATALATARNIAGQSFDGTSAITIASTDLSNTSAIALLTASQTLTNKTLTNPILSPTATTGGKVEFLEGTNNGTNKATLIGPASTADVTITLPAATDTLVGKATTDTFTNKTIDANGTGNSISNIDIGNMTAAVVVLESEGIGSNDNDTTLPTSAAVKDYADTKAVLSGSTDNQITTVTGAHAIQGESNLTFNGSTLAVTGAVTVSTTLGVTGASTLDGVTITDNTISTNASNAPLEIIANGTGPVKVTSGGVTFTLPTADGNAGDFLKTDGSGVLSFASSAGTTSDDTRVVIKNNKAVGSSPRTVDYFQATSADMAWYFMALNDLSNDHSSSSCFSVTHNNSNAFVSSARGGSSGSSNSLPTTSADISSGQVRVKIAAPSSDSKISYYKIPISRANTANETAGVTVTTANTDVDSASESIDSFAHASFRAAKYTILIDNDAKTETGVTEALVVHNGTDAFVSQFGTVNTGNNDMITLTAAISGSNVVLSAAGLEPNLSLKIHKILLSDSMSAVSNSNQKIIGATTVSSSATAFDDFDLDDAVAAVYYVVGKNATEGAFSVQEVYCSGAPGEASVSQGPFVSTKATIQLEFTAAFKSDADNSVELSVASTSGGSTVVNAYRINCLAE